MDQKNNATKRARLLTSKGWLKKTAWGAGDIFEYNKDVLRRSLLQAEWEYYRLNNGHFALQLLYGHSSVFGFARVLLVDLEGGYEHTAGVVIPFCGDRFDLDFSPEQPHSILFDKRDFYLSAGTNGRIRTVRCRSEEIEIDLACHDRGGAVSTALPFSQKRCFAFSRKKFFDDVRGKVCVSGIDYEINNNTFLVSESFRGVLPHHKKRLWCSGFINIGEDVLAINLGWGLGNTFDANENAIFLNGEIQKLGNVKRKVRSADPMRPCRFEDEDSRLSLVFTPEYNHPVQKKYLCFTVNFQQLFGSLDGHIMLDDGRTVKVNKMPAMLELGNMTI